MPLSGFFCGVTAGYFFKNFVIKLTPRESNVYTTTQIKKDLLNTANVKKVKTINVTIGIINHFLNRRKPLMDAAMTITG